MTMIAAPRVDIAKDARDLYRAYVALDRASSESALDTPYDAAAQHFGPTELAALLYAIVTINGWNRLAVATHMTYEP